MSELPEYPCAVAHGDEPVETSDRTLVAVFASPVANFLMRYGSDAGYRCVLVEPDPELAPEGAETVVPAALDGRADVVFTDHHRDELGTVLRDLLGRPVRWIGVMGNARHEPPWVKELAALGVPDDEIARVHRPIGLNIGSRTPPEIAIATLAGLIADRNGRPGGFGF